MTRAKFVLSRIARSLCFLMMSTSMILAFSSVGMGRGVFLVSKALKSCITTISIGLKTMSMTAAYQFRYIPNPSATMMHPMISKVRNSRCKLASTSQVTSRVNSFVNFSGLLEVRSNQETCLKRTDPRIYCRNDSSI